MDSWDSPDFDHYWFDPQGRKKLQSLTKILREIPRHQSLKCPFVLHLMAQPLKSMSITQLPPTLPENGGFQESAWLALARTGDFGAFEKLVDFYQDRLYRLARRITSNSQDAEDVVQQTFLSLIESIDTFRQDSSLWTWLVRVTTNHSLKILRKKKGLSFENGSGGEDTDEGKGLPHPEFIAEWRSGPEALAETSETRKKLDEAIEELDDKYRTVFLLRDVEGFSVKETSETLGITESTVKVRLLRARLMLREKLTRHFGDEAKRVIPDHRHG